MTFNYEKLAFVKTKTDIQKEFIGKIEAKKNLHINLTGAMLGQTEKELSFISHTNAVVALAALNNDEVASGSWDHTIKVWHSQTGKARLNLTGHSDAVSALISLPGSNQLVSGSWDETIKVWDLKKGVLKQTLSGHSDCVYSLCVLNGGKEIASGSNDNLVKVWTIATGACR